MKLYCNKCGGGRITDKIIVNCPKEESISMLEFAMNGGGKMAEKKTSTCYRHLLKCLDCDNEIYYITNLQLVSRLEQKKHHNA